VVGKQLSAPTASPSPPSAERELRWHFHRGMLSPHSITSLTARLPTGFLCLGSNEPSFSFGNAATARDRTCRFRYFWGHALRRDLRLPRLLQPRRNELRALTASNSSLKLTQEPKGCVYISTPRMCVYKYGYITGKA